MNSTTFYIEILKEYDIQIKHTQPIAKGKSSQAIKISANNTSYVFRTLKNLGQAQAEYKVSQILSRQRLSPAIILTNDGSPYVTTLNRFYNLQTYYEHHDILNRDIPFFTLGEKIGAMHASLSSAVSIPEQPDRFQLLHL